MKSLSEQFQEAGQLTGQRQLLRVQLQERFGRIVPELDDRIDTAGLSELETFARRVLRAESIEAVFTTD